MTADSIVSALIGLVGACGSNPKTDRTDQLLIRALAAPAGGAALDEAAIQALVEEIHRERDAVSPGCARCSAPCGNTSDYDMGRIDSADPAVRQAKRQVLSALQALAARVRRTGDGAADPDIFYRALAYVGCDMEAAPLLEILRDIREREAAPEAELLKRAKTDQEG